MGRTEVIAEAMGATATSSGRGAAILGPVAVGVSRTLHEVTDGLRRRGRRVLHLVAALGPLEALRDVPAAIEAAAKLETDVIVVDDAHLLDEHAAETVRLLCLNTDLTVVLGAHPEAGPSDALAWLWRSAVLSRFDLRPIDAVEAAASIEGGLEGPVHGGSAQLLWRMCGGRPGYVVDAVEAAVQSGALRKRNGLWRLCGTLPTSPALLDRARAHLAVLPDDLVDGFRLLSVAGRLDVTIAEAMLGAESLPALEGAGLISIEASHAATSAEPTIGMLAVATLELLGRAARTDCAHRLLERTGDEVPAPQRTRWRLVAGEEPSDDELAAAARDAHAAGDLATAELLARRAADGGDALALFLLTQIWEDQGRREEAAAVLRDLTARPNAGPEVQARAATELATVLMWDMGEPDAALAIARTVADAAAGTPYEATVAAFTAGTLLFAGRPTEALAQAEPLLDGGGRSHAEACLIVAAASAIVGRCEHGVDVGRRGVQARKSLGDELGLAAPEIQIMALVLALGEAGQLRDAEQVARDGYEQGLRVPGSLPGWMALARARIALLTGDVEDAARFANEAAVTFADLDQHATLRWALAGRILAAAYVARDDEATECSAALAELGPAGVRFLEPDVLRAHAFATAASGDLDRARREMEVAAGDAAEAGSAALEAMAWHDLVRLGGAHQALDRLTTLAPVVDSAWSGPRAAHAAACVAADVEGLLDVARRFEAMGARLHALEAGSHALAAARGRGSASAARLATREFRRHQAACPGARSPALRGAGLVALTRREREIAELAVAGLTSREVAARLGVSVRTVDNVLQRAYTKLGVRGRSELAARLEADTAG